MKSSFVRKFTLFVLAAGLFTFLLPTSSFAAEKTSTVTYQYIDFASLTQTEKNEIVKSTPNETATADQEDILLIYQKNTATTSQLANNTTSKTTTANTVAAQSKTQDLPKAGENSTSTINNLLGFSLIILVIGLAAWKRKIRQSLLIFILLGTTALGAAKSVSAAEKTTIQPATSETLTQGTVYTHQPETISGYTYVGYLVQRENTPEEKGTLTVNYTEEDGTLISTETFTGIVGEAYSITPKEIEGYILVSPTDAQTGTYVKTGSEITFIYREETGFVTVKYMTDNGTLISSETLTDDIGDPYEIIPKLLEGYDLVSSSDPRIGFFIKSGTEIIFIYKVKTREAEVGTVTAKSVDEEGNPLSPDAVFSGPVGSPYEVAPMFFDGYTLITPIGPQSGTYVKEGSEIVFIYRKNALNITLKMQNANSELLPTINTQTRGYISPTYYRVYYYDIYGFTQRIDQIHYDTTLTDEVLQYNAGDYYRVYSRVYFECYSVETNDRLYWGDYELRTETPELTEGTIGSSDITINYTLYDLSYP